MSYQMALEAAGAEVLKFQQFGSYQGDWWALVSYRGVIGWIAGAYGSCSGCDAFLMEFDEYSHEQGGEWHDPLYSGAFRTDCEECLALHARLAQFGARYLDDLLSQQEAEERAGRNLDWDLDAQEMIEFVRAGSGLS